MTTVRARCPECGDVALAIGDVTVRTGPGEPPGGSYRFRCPGCETMVTRDASARIVELLLSAGAPHERFTWPRELEERPGGPAWTADDILDLHVLLEQDSWFDRLVALVRPATPE